LDKIKNNIYENDATEYNNEELLLFNKDDDKEDNEINKEKVDIKNNKESKKIKKDEDETKLLLDIEFPKLKIGNFYDMYK